MFAAMEKEKLYTRAELLEYIKMNKPDANKDSENHFFGLTESQHEYISDTYKGLSLFSANPYFETGSGLKIIISSDGYILPYEPSDKELDPEFEQYKRLKEKFENYGKRI